MDLVDKNYGYYKTNLEQLRGKYPDKFVVISDEKVIFSDIDFNKAVEYAKKLTPGTYIIQKCETDKEKIVQTFHTRVRFSA